MNFIEGKIYSTKSNVIKKVILKSTMFLKLYDTLSKEKKEFKPIEKDKVRFYYCGPTVYKTQHIGGLRGNATADFIRRSLEYIGYDVNFVSNYTDVGHLTSDEDQGEDKLSKQANIEGKNPKEIADIVIKLYEQDSKDINILPPTTRCRATDYIQEMIDMIQVLIDKNFAYRTELAIYFKISKFENYTQLSKQDLNELKSEAGTGEVSDPEKQNTNDFVLWFFKAGTHKNALQTWESPWGRGFPGWHIECSAMSKKHLGDTLDIHMGGIEHISTHHTNEIAQSESANGVKFSNYWLHNEHLGIDSTKMSKSLGNIVLVKDVKEKNFDPLALRYFFLQAHYRSKQNFTWEALESAQTGLNRIYEQVASWGDMVGEVNSVFKERFIEKINDDFNTPQALAIVSELLKSDIEDKDKLATILDFDKVLGLKLNEAKERVETSLLTEELPQEIQDIIKERKTARENKDYQKSDELRDKLFELGYKIKDGDFGFKITKK